MPEYLLGPDYVWSWSLPAIASLLTFLVGGHLITKNGGIDDVERWFAGALCVLGLAGFVFFGGWFIYMLEMIDALPVVLTTMSLSYMDEHVMIMARWVLGAAWLLVLIPFIIILRRR